MLLKKLYRLMLIALLSVSLLNTTYQKQLHASTVDRFFLPFTWDAYFQEIYDLLIKSIENNLHRDWVFKLMPPLSIGDPQKGRLLFSHKLQSLFGLHVLDSDEAYTTYEVAMTLYALNAIVRVVHPNGSDLMVNDISQINGGVFKPHKTHQNGVDVDLRYYLKNVPPNDHEKRFVHPSILDEKRMWTLLQLLVQYELAESVLMDKSLQKALYDYAIKELKWTPQKISKYLSYPRGRGLVKHVPNHYHHFHIRFYVGTADQVIEGFDEIDMPKAEKIYQQHIEQKTGFYEYAIRDGQTLGAVANEQKVKLKDLLNWNNMTENSIIRAGQIIKIWR